MMDEFDSAEFEASPVAAETITVGDDKSDGFDDLPDNFEIPGFETKKLDGTQEEPTEAQAEKVPAEEDAEKVEATAESEPKTPPAPVRTVKAKVGDKELEIQEEALIPWRVDGKAEQVTLRALLDNYAGKTSYDRKFQAIANDRKALDGTKNRHKQLIVDLYEKTKAGKPFEAVQSMIEMTGVQLDARQYVKQLRDSLLEQAKQIAEMTPEQRQVFEVNEEREYLREQLNKLNQQRKDEEAAKALETSMATVAEKNGIPYDEFAQTAEFLRQAFAQRGEDAGLVTPEYVVGYREDLRAHEVARDAIKAVDPSLIDERGVVKDEDKWAELAKLAKTHLKDISPEEFVELYKQTRQTKQAQAVAKKLEKSPVSTPAKAALKKPKVDPLKAASDFTKFSADDLSW